MIVQFEKALLNTGQEDGHWPVPYPVLPQNDTELCQSGKSKGRTHKAVVVSPAMQSWASTHPEVLPAYYLHLI